MEADPSKEEQEEESSPSEEGVHKDNGTPPPPPPRSSSTRSGSGGGDEEKWCYCRLPFPISRREVDDARDVVAGSAGPRLRAIRVTEKLLLNGTKITYAFLPSNTSSSSSDDSDDGDGFVAFPDTVRRAFKVWETVGIGLRFHEIRNVARAHVRIQFGSTGGGNWSQVGRDIFAVPEDEPTMHLESNNLDVCLHEIGHTLGFKHEHQNPNAGIVWDDDAVYEFFSSEYEWTKKDVDNNILNAVDSNRVEASQFDPDSIMAYHFPPGLISEPERYRTEAWVPAPGLSEMDKEDVRRAYPPTLKKDNPPKVRLVPRKAVRLELRPGGQRTLLVKPREDGVYVIKTMGKSDALLVLFEEEDDDEDGEGELKVIAGDDDGGKRRNARIRVRLRKEGKYILKIRLYSEVTKAKTAVVMNPARDWLGNVWLDTVEFVAWRNPFGDDEYKTVED